MKCESILHTVYAAIKSPRRGLARNLIMSPLKCFLTEWLSASTSGHIWLRNQNFGAQAVLTWADWTKTNSRKWLSNIVSRHKDRPIQRDKLLQGLNDFKYLWILTLTCCCTTKRSVFFGRVVSDTFKEICLKARLIVRFFLWLLADNMHQVNANTVWPPAWLDDVWSWSHIFTETVSLPMLQQMQRQMASLSTDSPKLNSSAGYLEISLCLPELAQVLLICVQGWGFCNVHRNHQKRHISKPALLVEASTFN